MLILSVGMPRAGSGWFYNLTHDLMLANGAQDAHEIRKRYGLQDILTEVNCNIGAITVRRLLRVLWPSLRGSTYVIKAHAGPSASARALMHLGWMRVTYIYRDPRDAMLSAIENGRRARQKGRSNAFARLVDFDTALNFMQDYVRISEAWLALPQVHHVRYENLLERYDQEIQHLLSFLRIELEDKAVIDAIEKYRPTSPATEQKGLHFSHGKIGRFRLKMTPEEQEVMTQAFRPYLERTGYSL